MSAQEGHPSHASISHHEARVHRLEHVLRSYRTLTRDRLYELSGAEYWPKELFDDVLDEAVRMGRVRSLGGVLLTSVDD